MSTQLLQPDAPPQQRLRDASPIILSPLQVRQLKQVIQYVEYYQPLYGIKISPKPLRPCRDRAEVIAPALAPLGPHLRVIDFGASLGYFVFYLADRGVQAEGIDFMPQNVAAARTVAEINGLPCPFDCAELTLEYAAAIPHDRYDAALLLSVLHHITHQRGLAYTTQLVAELSSRIPVLILELAHANEQVDYAWRASQPADPLAILDGCKDVEIEKLGEFDTHLSAVRRRLWVVRHKS